LNILLPLITSLIMSTCLFMVPIEDGTPSQNITISQQINQMDTRQKIGQIIMPRLPWQTTIMNQQTMQFLQQAPFGGIILFGDNVVSIEQVQQLTADLQTQATIPLFIGIDEEGGRVSRVGYLFDTPIPSAFDIGRLGYPADVLAMSSAIGERLTQLGINTNFAPVADIWSNPANTVIGNRAFGHEASHVSPLMPSAIQGFHEQGILTTLKHFPGHGDTYEDSHFELAFTRFDLARFRNTEALPFQSGIDSGTDMVMVGHISTPYVQGHTAIFDWMQPWIDSGNLPATFSTFWLQDMLRDEMGFSGIIITDALDMRALTDHFDQAQIALGAFLAGNDILLMPARPQEAFNALLEAYYSGLITTQRLHQSLYRILTAKANF